MVSAIFNGRVSDCPAIAVPKNVCLSLKQHKKQNFGGDFTAFLVTRYQPFSDSAGTVALYVQRLPKVHGLPAAKRCAYIFLDRDLLFDDLAICHPGLRPFETRE